MWPSNLHKFQIFFDNSRHFYFSISVYQIDTNSIYLIWTYFKACQKALGVLARIKRKFYLPFLYFQCNQAKIPVVAPSDYNKGMHENWWRYILMSLVLLLVWIWLLLLLLSLWSLCFIYLLINRSTNIVTAIISLLTTSMACLSVE